VLCTTLGPDLRPPVGLAFLRLFVILTSSRRLLSPFFALPLRFFFQRFFWDFVSSNSWISPFHPGVWVTAQGCIKVHPSTISVRLFWEKFRFPPIGDTTCASTRMFTIRLYRLVNTASNANEPQYTLLLSHRTAKAAILER
jgi:hypothetical protein